MQSFTLGDGRGKKRRASVRKQSLCVQRERESGKVGREAQQSRGDGVRLLHRTPHCSRFRREKRHASRGSGCTHFQSLARSGGVSVCVQRPDVAPVSPSYHLIPCLHRTQLSVIPDQDFGVSESSHKGFAAFI